MKKAYGKPSLFIWNYEFNNQLATLSSEAFIDIDDLIGGGGATPED